jgi:hypothetical protein
VEETPVELGDNDEVTLPFNVVVTAKVIDEDRKPVSNVSVLAYKLNQNVVIGHGRTNEDGLVKISIKGADTGSSGKVRVFPALLGNPEFEPNDPIVVDSTSPQDFAQFTLVRASLVPGKKPEPTIFDSPWPYLAGAAVGVFVLPQFVFTEEGAPKTVSTVAGIVLAAVGVMKLFE